MKLNFKALIAPFIVSFCLSLPSHASSDRTAECLSDIRKSETLIVASGVDSVSTQTAKSTIQKCKIDLSGSEKKRLDLLSLECGNAFDSIGGLAKDLMVLNCEMNAVRFVISLALPSSED
ncbi:MAG: hypothetical protein LW875_04830 [Proteobacteria bacterium]|jgi:hypothetical protein|nr:hypothetical protein [Pseudomonadota bacterium]